MITSAPLYSMRHAGPAIVAGSGKNVRAEFDAAVGGCEAMPYVFACENVHRIVGAHAIASAHDGFFDTDELRAHPAVRHLGISDSGRPNTAGATFVWRGLKGGTSSLFAARLARHLGFNPVALVGSPLDASGHATGLNHDPNSPFATGDVAGLDHYRQAWLKAKREGQLDGVISISGWTRELLGWLDQR